MLGPVLFIFVNRKVSIYYMFVICSQLESIQRVQDQLNSFGGILKTLSQIERRQDLVVREYLAFLGLMLFNANLASQVS